jgi:hypothetical protein
VLHVALVVAVVPDERMVGALLELLDVLAAEALLRAVGGDAQGLA